MKCCLSRRYSFWLLAFSLTLLRADSAQFYNDWAAAHFSDIPAQSGATDDPDGDGDVNLVEFAFGTDPRSPGGIAGAVTPVFGSISETNGIFTVEVLEREDHQPGAQIDLYLSANLTNWFRPWWLRVTTNSQPSDPAGSVRESFTTRLPGTSAWFARAVVTLIEAGPETAKYYVATDGNDSNSGTNIAAPFKTLAKAVSLSVAGDLIYMRGGVYTNATKVSIGNPHNGAPGNPIRLRAYPGEKPVLNFSAQTFSSSNRGLELSARWWHIYGLEIFGAGDNGMNISGISNVIELCVIHDCRDTGLQISGPGSSNLVLNCDSYHNFDTVTHGENADGFAPKLAGLGPNNVFRGCRAWENADDGWDMFAAPNAVLLDHCWSFRNGTNVINDPQFQGDGNGFKLGGVDNNTGVAIAAPHRVVDCVAFGNTHNGIDQNNNSAGLTIDNNTVWGSAGKNFYLDHGAVTQGVHVVRNNLSIGGTSTFAPGTLFTNNSWQLLTAPPASVSDVLSVDESFAQAPRRDDGGLPETPFLRPVPAGRLVDQGVILTEPFSGPAPDLGAFETPQW